MCHIKKLNETLPCKNEFYSPLGGKGIIDKVYQLLSIIIIINILSKFGINLEWKRWKTITIST